MKRTILVLVMTVLMISMCAGIFSNAAETSNDPADNYVPQTAPYEDSSLQMWFEHSFKKVMTSDTTHSGKDSYSVYMGKNEIENAQFVLYSDETKTKLRPSLSAFTNENGDTISASVYYQMYVTLSNLETLGFLGATEENTFIRNGEQPDPIVPMSAIGTLQLNAGKSQAFYIRLETTEDTKPGWYSAQLDIKNSMGQTIKTRTVYAYVWDFTLSDKSPLQTSFYLDNKSDQYGSFEKYYNYLLENRINAMDIPNGLTSNNPYLTDERVNSIRVSSAINGGVYKDNISSFPDYEDIYTDLSSMKEWDSIKDKFYFYTIDEAMSYEQQYGIYLHYLPTCLDCGQKSESTTSCTKCGSTNLTAGSVRAIGSTVDDVINYANVLENYWPDAAKVVPYHENHPYPYNKYDSQTMATLDPTLLYDGAQAMIDTESINIWCPQLYAFTPLEVLESYGYNGRNDDGAVRSLSGSISGSIRAGENYFNWEKVFGEFRDRAISSNIVRNRTGAGNNVLWAYSAGWNKSYTYCNHLIESSGLQTKMLFWQLYQNDITGYLYYGTNNWNEYKYDLDGDGKATEVIVDNTTTGAKTGGWHLNEHRYDNGDGTFHAIYGNGTLFYMATQGNFTKVPYVGSIRIDHIRDGIDEYQMLTMLEELKGDSAADEIVNSVSNNVASYLSIPSFDRSAFDSSMDEYDIMASVRIELGNALEAAYDEVCNHKFDDGKVTLEPDCKTLGEKTYTCTLCGAESIEYIPALHSDDNCWTETVIKAVSCTSSGTSKLTCTECGYAKQVTIPAHHSNEDKLTYTPHEKMPGAHNVICTVCKTTVTTANHVFYAEYTNTCTEAGTHNKKCYLCGYTTTVKNVDAKGHYLVETYVAPTCQEEGYRGEVCQNCDYTNTETLAIVDHNYVDGKCTMCGDSLVVKGDVDGDGEVSPLDYFQLKLILAQKITPTEEQKLAANVDGSEDPDPNMLDSFAFKFYLAKGYWGN